MTSFDLQEYALRYAAAGYKVLPIRPRDKIPLTKRGAHDATTDAEQIKSWWFEWPDANIGVTLEGLVVVDIDPRNGGDVDALPKLPDTCFAKTGGGGWHYLYTGNGVKYKTHPAAGIDVKTGAGQYIVVEPSIHPSGEQYNWLDETEPWAVKPVEAPAWLAEVEQPKQQAPHTEGKIGSGGRNNALTSMAGAMRRKGMTPAAIEAALIAENASRCDPPLPEADVRKIAASVGRYEPAGEAQEKTKPSGSGKAAAINWTALTGQEPPARRWVITGWLGHGHTTLLVGPGGIGKTLLAQQVASSRVLGRDHIDTIGAVAPVLMWACEDDFDELWRRQMAIARSLKVGLEAFTDFHLIPRHGLDNALVSTEFGRLLFTPLIEELRQQALDLRVDTVILDNVAQLYGGNENDRHSVTVFLNALVGALPDMAILLLAHPSRGAGSEFSGSGAWENVARTRLYLGSKLPDQQADADEEPQDDVRYLARRKANYSAKDWRRFTYRDGVLVPDSAADGEGMVGAIRERSAERVVLAGLKRLADMNLTATDGTTSARYLPKLLGQYKLSEGHSKTELADAMRRLMLADKVRRAVVGKDDSRHGIWGLKEV